MAYSSTRSNSSSDSWDSIICCLARLAGEDFWPELGFGDVGDCFCEVLIYF
jgi:hypothetical protein